MLRSGKVNQWTGSEVTSFEKEYADYVGVKYAVALANGSVALDIALVILGIVPGDEVIVTPRSFVASAGCVALRDAIPVFVDVDHDSQNITPDTVKNAISSKTKAVIAVHLAGWPCELDELKALCDEHGIYLIEDCAQAHGAGIGSQMSEVGGRKTEDGRRRAEDGGRRTEGGGRKTEDGGQKTEVGGRKTEDGGRKTEDGRRRTEDRRQRTEGRGRRAEVGSRRTIRRLRRFTQIRKKRIRNRKGRC